MIGLEFIAKTFDEQFKTIAESLGISPKTVNDWVKGRKKIPIARRKQLAEHFGLKEDYFQKELSRVEELDILKENVHRHSPTYVFERTIVDELGDEYLIEDTANDSEEELRSYDYEQERAILLEKIDLMVMGDEGPDYLEFFQDLIRVVKNESARRLMFLVLGSVTPGIGTVSYVGVQNGKEAAFTKALEDQLIELDYKGTKRSLYRYPEHSS